MKALKKWAVSIFSMYAVCLPLYYAGTLEHTHPRWASALIIGGMLCLACVYTERRLS